MASRDQCMSTSLHPVWSWWVEAVWNNTNVHSWTQIPSIKVSLNWGSYGWGTPEYFSVSQVKISKLRKWARQHKTTKSTIKTMGAHRKKKYLTVSMVKRRLRNSDLEHKLLGFFSFSYLLWNIKWVGKNKREKVKALSVQYQ